MCWRRAAVCACVAQLSLAPFGLPLFAGDAVMTDRSFTLLHCLGVLRSDGRIQFVDDHISRTLNVQLLLPPTGRPVPLCMYRPHARRQVGQVTCDGVCMTVKN